MRLSISQGCVGLLLALCIGSATWASEPRGTVVIGQVTCFRLRVPDRGMSVQQRVDYIQDMAPKFLGGDPVEFSIRPVGDEQHIDANGQFIVAVTPADAHATGYKSAAALAPIWREALERAFAESSARPVPPPAVPAP